MSDIPESKKKPAKAAKSPAKVKPRAKSPQKPKVLTPEELKSRSPKAKPTPKQPKKAKQVRISTDTSGAKTEAPTRGRGRPSKYTPELVAEIVHRIAQGEPLRQICLDDHMPHWTVVYDWEKADKEFSLRIAQARELGEEAIAQECLEIADDDTRDWEMVRDKDGQVTGIKVDGEHVQRSKLRIETRLKLLAKWNPRKWGERVDLNHGGQPDNPLGTLIQRVAGSGLPIKGHDE